MNKIYHGFSHCAGIYKITNIENGVVYFGQAAQLGTRAQQHERNLVAGAEGRVNSKGKLIKHHNCYLQDAWNKYKSDAFEFEVIAVYPDKTERTAAEQALIDEHYGPGCYNIATDATVNGMSGRKHEQETKDKIAAAKKGIKLSVDHCAAIGAGLTGKKRGPYSVDHCAAIGAGKKGKPSGHKGKKVSETTRKINIAAWVKRREAKALLIDNIMKDLAQ